MRKSTFFGSIFLAAVVGASIGVASYALLLGRMPAVSSVDASLGSSGAIYAPSYAPDTIQKVVSEESSFVYAAKSTIASVVHIRLQKKVSNTYMFPFLGDENVVQGTGSGVIISSDGYIVTNNHVIEDASSITVGLSDNRIFEATLVGTDVSTDLALLRIDAEDLRAIPIGDSDHLEIGSWVLAVGHPFELRSTVTAGIVSAKGRHINSISDPKNLGIEAFIQTDAVVNQGNSGGALVNLEGELVGVNTAIFTRTGGYDGYSFAVPSKLVQKVMEDLRLHGTVQRAWLGVEIRDLNAQLAKQQGASATRGVLIVRIARGSAAEKTKLRAGDIIVALNDKKLLGVPQLQEQIARRRPGDQVRLTILRKKHTFTVNITLKAVPHSPDLSLGTILF